MDINNRKKEALNKLNVLAKELVNHIDYSYANINYLSHLKQQIAHALVIEFLIKDNHPFVDELNELGLVDYYKNVLELVRKKVSNESDQFVSTVNH